MNPPVMPGPEEFAAPGEQCGPDGDPPFGQAPACFLYGHPQHRVVIRHSCHESLTPAKRRSDAMPPPAGKHLRRPLPNCRAEEVPAPRSGPGRGSGLVGAPASGPGRPRIPKPEIPLLCNGRPNARINRQAVKVKDEGRHPCRVRPDELWGAGQLCATSASGLLRPSTFIRIASRPAHSPAPARPP